MDKVEFDPSDGWTLVVVTWDDIMNHPHYPIRDILEWIEEHKGGRYTLRGYESTEGFEFRFELPEDAVYFKLRWL